IVRRGCDSYRRRFVNVFGLFSRSGRCGRRDDGVLGRVPDAHVRSGGGAAGMGPKITFIGGGSYQWTSKLLIDLVNMPSLVDADVVIEDIDRKPIPRMLELVEHMAEVRGIGLKATGTTNQREALEGADYVVVCISTGALESMGRDIAIPERYGIKQSVG